MKTKDLDKWFNNLDSSDMANIFPGVFNNIMMSADPDIDINDFIDEALDEWDSLSTEEKQKIYKDFH